MHSEAGGQKFYWQLFSVLCFISVTNVIYGNQYKVDMGSATINLKKKVEPAKRNLEPLVIENPVNITELEENVCVWGGGNLKCLSTANKLEINERVSLDMGQVSTSPIRSRTHR